MTAAALCVCSAVPTLAQIESDRLFAEGAWSVDVNHDPGDGSLFCDAYSGNRDGQLLQIIGTDGGELLLTVTDPDWSIPSRAVRFLVDIDYDRWTTDGLAQGNTVIADLNDPTKVAQFFADLSEGSAIAIFNDDVRRLAVFSLRGSSAALNALGECWSRIFSSDPFQTASNPF